MRLELTNASARTLACARTHTQVKSCPRTGVEDEKHAYCLVGSEQNFPGNAYKGRQSHVPVCSNTRTRTHTHMKLEQTKHYFSILPHSNSRRGEACDAKLIKPAWRPQQGLVQLLLVAPSAPATLIAFPTFFSFFAFSFSFLFLRHIRPGLSLTCASHSGLVAVHDHLDHPRNLQNLLNGV